MHKKNPSAFAVLISVFFFWGFVAASNDILIPVFKKALNLQNWQSQLINFAFYMAYTIGSLIYIGHATLTRKDLISRIGYQNSIAVGLGISALGTLLFLPAAAYNSFGIMIAGLFVVGLGFSLQQTAANPFALALGSPEKGSQRLSLAGGVNNIGTTIGPLILTYAIFGSLGNGDTTASMDDVKQPYLYLGVAFILAAIVFMISAKRGKIKPGESAHERPPKQEAKEKRSIFSFPQLSLGMLGIFFYVGVEVATAGNIGEYLNATMGDQASKTLAPVIALYWASLMIGRWGSAAAVFTASDNVRVVLKILLPYIAFGLFLGVTSIAGYDIQPFLAYAFVIPLLIIADFLSKEDPAKQLLLFSLLGIIALITGMLNEGMVSVYAFISVGLFCSTLWPCIYTLATRSLGEKTSQGSSLLIMMIMGGAIISLSQGILADIPSVGIRYSFIIGVICFSYLAFYAMKMKIHFKEKSHESIN